MKRGNVERRIREAVERAGFGRVAVSVALTGSRRVSLSADVARSGTTSVSLSVSVARRRSVFVGEGWPERLASAFVREALEGQGTRRALLAAGLEAELPLRGEA